MILPISASQVARIIDVSHQCLAKQRHILEILDKTVTLLVNLGKPFQFCEHLVSDLITRQLGYRNSKIHFVFTFTYLLLSPNLVSMYK
jgi:hypothetical protein